jgi:hypothetical protein
MTQARKVNMKARIERWAKEVDDLTFEMQLFCLNPTEEIYKKIISCERLKMLEGIDYDTWKLAVDVTYPFGKSHDDAVQKKKFNKASANMCAYLLEKPTKGLHSKVWHLFFATGDYKYLDYIFQTSGNEAFDPKLREYSTDLYIKIKNTYEERIEKLMLENPDHFDRMPHSKAHFDFSNFERGVDRQISEAELLKPRYQKKSL